MTFAVALTPEAEEDLLRLFDFLLARTSCAEDLDYAQRVLDAVRITIDAQLSLNPFSFRKSGDGRRSTRRELIVPAGATGYVLLYEIAGPTNVVVLAVRHQREDDYH